MRRILAWILKQLSRAVLWRYRPFIVGITGSVGKTSTKEAIALVLEAHSPGKVRKSEKNLNTEIGLPLAVMGGIEANRDIMQWVKNLLRGLSLIMFTHQYPRYLILELAADRPGDIHYFAKFIPLDVAVVTAIGEMPAHLEFFSSRDEYIKEKAAILDALKPGGVAILNYDDETVRALAKRIPESRKVLAFGYNENAAVRAEGRFFETAREGLLRYGISFKVDHQGSVVPVRLNYAVGEGAIYATLGAIAVGVTAGMNLVDIAEALLPFRSPPGRLNILEGIKDVVIVDDSYNASPLAAKVALAVLSFFKGNRKVVIFGDMLELGENTERAHRELGREIATATDVAILVGKAVEYSAEELESRGYKKGEDLFLYANDREAREHVPGILVEQDVVLVKGSQSMRLERVIKEIMAEPERAGELLVRQDERWLKTP